MLFSVVSNRASATSSVPSPSKCTQIVGGAYSAPQAPSWIKGAYF